MKVNWDALGRDYLENFVPLISECIRLAPDDVVSLQDLQSQLQTEFGLVIPQNIIHTLLRRVSKRGYIRRAEGIYTRNNEKLAVLGFQDVQQRVLVMYGTLVSDLRAFCSEEYGVNWTSKQADEALQVCLEQSRLPIRGARTQGSLLPVVSASHDRSARFYVASFLKHLMETHSAVFNLWETIVKGNMLANAVFLPDPGQYSRKFRKTEVYFDTSFLVYALGYAGEPRKGPCLELLELVYETGADLRCFEHTVDEMRNILEACRHRIAEERLSNAFGPSIDYFVLKGYTASDIALISARLERDLGALRIRVVPKPPYLRQHNPDEQKLQDMLSSEMRYRNPQALSRDVDSIAAIIRLRRGQTFYYIESCRALFISTNTNLVRVSRDFHYLEASNNAVVPCLTDYALTNLLWLKKPLKAPDLPRKRIIADCYAVTQPNEHLWQLYLKEIERLRENGKVTADDYHLLRYSLDSKQVLMELTHGDEGVFTQGTVAEVLELTVARVQADVKAKMGEQLAVVVEAQRKAEGEAEASRARDAARRSTVEANAQRYASVISQVIGYGVMLGVLVGSLASFPWGLPPISTTAVRYTISVLMFLVLILGVANLIWGTDVRTLIRRLEVALSHWIEKKLVALTEPPSDSKSLDSR